MNIRETVTIRSPNGKDEECAKFTIDEVARPFTFFGATEENEKYVFSAWVMAEEESTLNIEGKEIPVTTEWKRQKVSYVSSTNPLKIYFNKNGVYYFYQSQLEIGDVMTDWAPSPVDIEEAIKSANAKLELKVNKDTLKSEINALADTFTFTGNGFVVNAKNLTITEDGTIKATNGEFTGKIKTSSGEIGGFSILSTNMRSTNGNIIISSNGYIKITDDEPRKIVDMDGEVIDEFYPSTMLQNGYISLLASDGVGASNRSHPSMSLDCYGITLYSAEDAEGNVTAWANIGAELDGDVKSIKLYEGFVDAPRIFTSGTIYAGTHMRIGDDQVTTSARAITTYWYDDKSHNIVERSADGLTSAFGWAGSSTYGTVTKIRGRTCQYQNSAGTTTLSDERLKKDFTEMDKWESFYDSLIPCAFRMKTGNSGRYHMGFRAQQVENSLLENGLTTKDFAGFVRMKYMTDEDDPEGNAIYSASGIEPGMDELGLIYTEFVAMNTWQIQKLKQEIAEIKNMLGKE